MFKNITTSRKIFRAFLVGFAFIGLTFVFVFISMQFGLLNVKGATSERNSYFNIKKNSISKTNSNSLLIFCQINTLGKYAPITSINIYKTLNKGADDLLLGQMVSVASKRFENDVAFNNEMNNCASNSSGDLILPMSAYDWADTDQWNLMKEVFTRDQEIIKKAASDAGISPRLILSGVIGEQFRFFNNRRESFKGYFEPLKILASLSKISYGIAGIKPKTVGQIEDGLKNPNSPLYLGKDMEDIITYSEGADIEAERMTRITDAKNPYYSYLYVGLYMREIMAQWERAGYNLNNRPEILATLYNLGFYYSVPKANPEAGGSVININGKDYIFGDLAYEFYYSGELSDTFPIVVQ